MIEHEKINVISPSSHVLFYLLYKFSSIFSKGEYSKGHIRTRVLIRHFSVVKIPITHCTLYNKMDFRWWWQALISFKPCKFIFYDDHVLLVLRNHCLYLSGGGGRGGIFELHSYVLLYVMGMVFK